MFRILLEKWVLWDIIIIGLEIFKMGDVLIIWVYIELYIILNGRKVDFCERNEERKRKIIVKLFEGRV